MLQNINKITFLVFFSWTIGMCADFAALEEGHKESRIPTVTSDNTYISPLGIETTHIPAENRTDSFFNHGLRYAAACTRNICLLGAEVIVSGVVGACGLALISVASGYQSAGESKGAHYVTKTHYVCSSGGKCRTVTDTYCVGSTNACSNLTAATVLFSIGGAAILGVGAFWGYKIYNNYETYCVRRQVTPT